MDKTVKSVQGVALALSDLITRAGDGDLVGGRLEGAIADGGWLDYVTITIGTRHYRIHVEDLDKLRENAPHSS